MRTGVRQCRPHDIALRAAQNIPHAWRGFANTRCLAILVSTRSTLNCRRFGPICITDPLAVSHTADTSIETMLTQHWASLCDLVIDRRVDDSRSPRLVRLCPWRRVRPELSRDSASRPQRHATCGGFRVQVRTCVTGGGNQTQL